MCAQACIAWCCPNQQSQSALTCRHLSRVIVTVAHLDQFGKWTEDSNMAGMQLLHASACEQQVDCALFCLQSMAPASPVIQVGGRHTGGTGTRSAQCAAQHDNEATQTYCQHSRFACTQIAACSAQRIAFECISSEFASQRIAAGAHRAYVGVVFPGDGFLNLLLCQLQLKQAIQQAKR
jgi:hypothetical protein